MAFLTTDANQIVRPIHPKAMPVLIAADDYDVWLRGPWDEAAGLATSPLSDRLQIVNIGAKTDTVNASQIASV